MELHRAAIDLPGRALDSLAAHGVRLRLRGGRLEVRVPAEAHSERLNAWIARHRDALVALACGRCGVIPYSTFTDDGSPRCEAHAPGRCRVCYLELPHGGTSCVGCSDSPLVKYALERGLREAAP